MSNSNTLTKPVILAQYKDCWALLTTEGIKPKDFMAGRKAIYEAPDIDGFIGFLKVIACSIKKGQLPLINEYQIIIPDFLKNEEFYKGLVEINQDGSLVINEGFVNLISIDPIT
jgi:hypothetical protein